MLNEVISQICKDEVAALENFLPSFDRLVHVGQSFPPNVHGAPVVLQVPRFSNCDHASTPFNRLNYLLEQNQVLVVNAVHVLRKYVAPL